MDEEALNMSVRRFLKTLGVTAQREIEHAVREGVDAGDLRGDEALGSAWAYLDMTALGRQEDWEDSPEGYPQTKPYGWWNLHDEYDNATVFEAALSQAAASQRGSRSRS